MGKNTGKNGSTPLSAIGVALAAKNYNSLMPNPYANIIQPETALLKPTSSMTGGGNNRPSSVTIEEMQVEKASMREFQKQREAAQRQQELLKKTAGSQKGNPVSMFLPTYGSEADLAELEGALIKATPIAMEKRTDDARRILSQRHGRPATIEELQAEKASIREFQRQREELQKRQELMDKANNSYTGSGTNSTLPKTNGKTNVPDIEGALIKPNPIAMENRTEDAQGILSQRHGRPATIEELQAEKARAREFQRQQEEYQRRHPMPRPEPSSSQSAKQYGPYFDMQLDYPTTMAGLRLAEEQHQRNVETFGRPPHAQPLDLSFPSVPSVKDYNVLPDDFNVYKAGGKALAVVGYAIDALNIATAVEADLKDFDKRIGKKTAAAVGGAASSAVFGALGAAAFSILAAGMAGALMGSVLPGPGTIVGFIGGLVGGMIGAAAGEEFSDWVINQIDWDE